MSLAALARLYYCPRSSPVKLKSIVNHWQGPGSGRTVHPAVTAPVPWDITPLNLSAPQWKGLFFLYASVPRNVCGDIMDSAPSLGVYYFLSLTLSVCRSVCLFVTLLLQIDSSFFVSQWNRAIFLAASSQCGTLQNFFFNFWFRPLVPKMYSPKFACRSLSQS